MPPPAWLLLTRHPEIWGRLGKERGTTAREGDETFAALQAAWAGCFPSLSAFPRLFLDGKSPERLSHREKKNIQIKLIRIM